MPWQEVTVMQQKEELMLWARQPGANKSELARRFGVSPKTLHKWLKRYAQDGPEGLREQSRAPKRIHRLSEQTAALILRLRDAHPAWGARKILARLEHLGHTSLPCESTANRLLKRHERIHPETSRKHKAWQRFEHDAPNLLWQMDFKGHFAMLNDLRCHPLTLLDDHSRYSLCLQACENEQGKTVRGILTRIFRQYGLPRQMLMDNGSPWGHSQEHPHTELTVWLLRLGIRVSHGRPHHPQTQGKEERFHRTLNAELLRGRVFRDAQECQQAFDLQYATPASGLGDDLPRQPVSSQSNFLSRGVAGNRVRLRGYGSQGSQGRPCVLQRKAIQGVQPGILWILRRIATRPDHRWPAGRLFSGPTGWMY